jgi:hypothetical protein
MTLEVMLFGLFKENPEWVFREVFERIGSRILVDGKGKPSIR